MQNDSETTHFGYQEVPVAEKANKVAEVFHSVADQYDLMNDLMSLGCHRLWKRMAIKLGAFRPGQSVLDLAGGTGDLASLISPIVGPSGQVVLADINASMLRNGRDRLIDRGQAGNVRFSLANAERLPFADNSFDRIVIGFGLRNITDKQQALNSMLSCLKPGGLCEILEFSQPTLPVLKPLYDWYSFQVLPGLGKLVADDSDSYRYLAESIRRHPDQQTLLAMMQTAGFEDCDYHNLAGGIVAIHRGYKY